MNGTTAGSFWCVLDALIACSSPPKLHSIDHDDFFFGEPKAEVCQILCPLVRFECVTSHAPDLVGCFACQRRPIHALPYPLQLPHPCPVHTPCSCPTHALSIPLAVALRMPCPCPTYALPLPSPCPCQCPGCRDSFARSVQTHRPTAKAQVERLEKVRLVVGVCRVRANGHSTG